MRFTHSSYCKCYFYIITESSESFNNMSFPLSLSHHHKKKSEQRNWHKIVFALCKLATFFFVCAFFLLKNLFVVVSCVDGSLIIDGKSYRTILKVKHVEDNGTKLKVKNLLIVCPWKAHKNLKLKKYFIAPRMLCNPLKTFTLIAMLPSMSRQIFMFIFIII